MIAGKKRAFPTVITRIAAGADRSKQLLSRDDIQSEYGLSRRWLELAALTGNGPAFIKISPRMVRYQRGEFESWLVDRTVTSTSQTEVRQSEQPVADLNRK